MPLQVEIDELAATIRVGDGGGLDPRAERRLIEAVLAAVEDRLEREKRQNGATQISRTTGAAASPAEAAYDLAAARPRLSVARWAKGEETIPSNPTELVLEKKVQFAEIGIPGLTAPLQQFVRGNAEVLTVELFFDTSDKGMGAQALSVATETDRIYSLARIDPDGHAPPIVEFQWGPGFPGSSLSDKLASQCREHFTGLVSSVRQTFTLFSAGGIPLRAKVSLTIIEYETLDDQLSMLNLKSPDRTHGHVVQAGDELWSIANLYYERPSAWRTIAVANRIDDPRRLTLGRPLSVPAIAKGAGA